VEPSHVREEWRRIQSLQQEERLEYALELYKSFAHEFEEENPRWFEQTTLDIIYGALMSLQNAVENEADTDVCWPLPLAEIQFPIDWDFEQSSTTFGNITEAAFDTYEEFTRTITSIALKHQAHVVLESLTRGAAYYIRSGVETCYLRRDLLEQLETAAPAERDAVLRSHFEPLLIGMDQVQVHEDEDGTDAIELAQRESREPLPPLTFSLEWGDKEILTVHVMVAFHPLIVNEDERRAYFPITTGLSFDQMHVDPACWSRAEREEFWSLLLQAFNEELRKTSSAQKRDGLPDFVLRCVIVPADRHADLVALRSDLAAGVVSLVRLAESIRREHQEWTTDSPEKQRLAYAAWRIHGWYTRLEDVLSQIARRLDQRSVGGARSHADLLQLATDDAPGLRGPVFDPEIRTDLDQLRGFRHFFRHCTDVELDPKQVNSSVERVLRIDAKVIEALHRLDSHVADVLARRPVNEYLCSLVGDAVQPEDE
jgi:hypothetical protein